jgi:hypothetical protein
MGEIYKITLPHEGLVIAYCQYNLTHPDIPSIGKNASPSIFTPHDKTQPSVCSVEFRAARAKPSLFQKVIRAMR